MNKERGLFVGRFNPFHKGHLKAVQDILEQEDEIIIAIGSTQQSHTVSDPFTAGERVLMIRAAMKELDIPLERVYIVTIPDIHRNSVWVSHLRSYCPPFRRIYTNNSLTRRLFMEAGMEVRSTGPFNRVDFKGAQIRKHMAEGTKWSHMVPKAVWNIIESIDGLNRLQDILHETD
ncbi:MAG: nicotinamide-nucleotide adenylyltransferase [Candidatus Heimdallarchaeota archaeon]|nr:MAG: nicotinamide-nucleotide adenylyltransferase [Candidatus Heimdallarchaeota archaeon]